MFSIDIKYSTIPFKIKQKSKKKPQSTVPSNKTNRQTMGKLYTTQNIYCIKDKTVHGLVLMNSLLTGIS